MQVRDLAGLVACELSAEHLALFDGAMNESNQMSTHSECAARLDLPYTADGLNCFSADVATLSKTHDSRVLTHARQMRTTPRHTIPYIFTRHAAGVATITPARSRGLVG